MIFRLSVSVSCRVKFNENCPPPLDILTVFEGEGALLERGIVTFEKGDQLILRKRVKAGREKKSAEPDLRDLALGPCPE